MTDELLPLDYQADIDSIGLIPAVSTILDVVCRMTGMGFAAVARVTEDRWIACSVQDEIQFGLTRGGELKIETTLCSAVRQIGSPVIISDVAQSPEYFDHPSPTMYGFQSYVSIPIVMPDGSFFGTLCAIDPKPRLLNKPEMVESFKLFATLIAFHLDANLRVARTEATLSRERETSQLREQFIAVVGHDLRNPLASVRAGLSLLLRRPERHAVTMKLIEQSISRMEGLIDNILDFARGRLGGGLTLDRNAERPLEPTLLQVVQELRSTHPDRVIDVSFTLEQPVRCDHARVAQLLSNLLANALTHGASAEPIRVSATADTGIFRLSVSNAGAPIPEATLANLFQPFFRGGVQDTQEGLGLGLYIASEIARAHGGELTATSTTSETRFTFWMPIM